MTPAPGRVPSEAVPGDLTDRPWPEVGRPVVVLPLGSTEQHGPHLPLDTDTVIAEAVAVRLAERLRHERDVDVAVARPLAYGASGEHEGFPGTMSIGHEALHAVLVELGRSACRWAAGVVFVNGHGGNVPTLKKAVELLRYEGRAVAWTSCDLPGADAHAGGVCGLLCGPRSIARSRWGCGAGRSRGDRTQAPSGVVLRQELLGCVVDIGRAGGRVEDDVILGFGGRGRERGIWLDAESFSCAAEGRGVAAAGEAHPL